MKEGVTSREVTKYGAKYGYVDKPIDRDTVAGVSKGITYIKRNGGQISVMNDEESRGRKYRYSLTESGWDYYNWLKNHYREKAGRFPPREV